MLAMSAGERASLISRRFRLATSSRSACGVGYARSSLLIVDDKKPSGVTSLPTDELASAAGGRYVFVGRLGAGGMGEVYRAEDTRLKRPVAIKRLPIQKREDERLRSRLQAEAERTSALNHPNVAVIYDVLEEQRDYLIVMEYVEGRTLRERLHGAGSPQPMALDEFFRLAIQAADGVAAAHEKGIVHCDIKPENIMLAGAGGQQVKILDFGIARHIAAGDDPTQTGMRAGIAGTPGYVPPEVILGEPASARADIFALGVTFYEMLTGHHPFLTGNPLGAVQRILHDAPPSISQAPLRYPAALEKIVARMLAREPERRYASAAELARDLRAAQTDLVLQPAARRRTRRAMLLTAMAVLLLATGAFLPLYLARPEPPGGRAQQRHLAVLPFRVIGGQPEERAFGDGLTTTLSTKLTQLSVAHQLQVASPSEVRALAVDTPEKARRELGVNLVVEGTMQRAGDSVRVNFALVDTGSKRIIRSQTITANANDPFAVEDRVVEGALRLLVLEIRDQERASLGGRGTRIARAYDEYLKGLGYLQAQDPQPENVEAALASFGRALQLDPEYAAAYAGVGEANLQRYRTAKERQWMEAARQGCQRSVELDPALAAGHICLGNVLTQSGQYREAAAEFDLALGYEPSSDAAYVGLARAYQRMDRWDEAERTFQKAIQVRPQYASGYQWLGVLYLQRARYREAVTTLRRAVELAPESARAWRGLAGALMGQGEYEAAVRAAERALSIRPEWGAYSNLGLANFYLRRYSEAIAALEKAVELAPNQQVALGNLARAYHWSADRRAQAPAAYRRAIAAAEQDLRVNPDDTDAHILLANYHAYLGEKRLSLEHLGRVLRPGEDPETLFQAALVYTMLGDRRRALDALQQAAKAGYSPAELRAAPEFDTLRSDARFAALVGSAPAE